MCTATHVGCMKIPTWIEPSHYRDTLLALRDSVCKLYFSRMDKNIIRARIVLEKQIS